MQFATLSKTNELLRVMHMFDNVRYQKIWWLITVYKGLNG